MKKPSITCENCKACCCKVFGIYELSDEDKSRLPKRYWFTTPLYPGKALMRTKGFHCAALNGCTDRCTIYPVRPDICRRFKPGSKLCLMARAEHKLRYENHSSGY